MITHKNDYVEDSKEDVDFQNLKSQAKKHYLNKNYKKSSEILHSLAIRVTGQKKTKILKLITHLNRIENFQKRFEESVVKSSGLSKNWYELFLYEQLENKKNIIDSHANFVIQEDNSVFILGPAKAVNSLRGLEQNSYHPMTSIPFPYPKSQINRDGCIYHSDQVFFINLKKKNSFHYSEVLPQHKIELTKWDFHDFKESQIIKPNPNLEVFYSNDIIDKETHESLRRLLDAHAKKTQDYFVPMYHNIIDPNLTVLPIPEKGKIPANNYPENNLKWTATEFFVESYPLFQSELTHILSSACLKLTKQNLSKYIIGQIFSFLVKNGSFFMPTIRARISSPISDLNVRENQELHLLMEDILNKSLPILTKLSKPVLLFPGKLQAVIKAQRIYFKPGEEYVGVWHKDGKNEKIVAVILFYYRVSKKLHGGDLEFFNKKTQDFWVGGDCSPDDFSFGDAKELVEANSCRVPIKEGTLVVFSNYQLIHRVLRMCYPDDEEGDPMSPDGLASKDFLAFFVVDQRDPLLSTTDYFRWKEGDLIVKKTKENNRKALFFDQIKPSGSFGLSKENVYSTGNGSVAMLGWLENMEFDSEDEEFKHEFLIDRYERCGFKNLDKLNKDPPLDRGASWAVESKDTYENCPNEKEKKMDMDMESEEEQKF